MKTGDLLAAYLLGVCLGVGIGALAQLWALKDDLAGVRKDDKSVI